MLLGWHRGGVVVLHVLLLSVHRAQAQAASLGLGLLVTVKVLVQRPVGSGFCEVCGLAAYSDSDQEPPTLELRRHPLNPKPQPLLIFFSKGPKGNLSGN